MDDADGKTTPVITNKNFDQIKKWVGGSASTDVTGGMIHKVEESLKLAGETGIETILVNGNEKGNLEKAVLGEKVTSTKIKN